MENKIIKEWIESWEQSFKQDGIENDKKFWYPIPIRIMSGETQKAQVIQVCCHDHNTEKEMLKGFYTTHPLGGKDCTCQMWMPKKVIDYNARKAPYGLIKQNLEKCMSQGITNLAKYW